MDEPDQTPQLPWEDPRADNVVDLSAQASTELQPTTSVGCSSNALGVEVVEATDSNEAPRAAPRRTKGNKKVAVEAREEGAKIPTKNEQCPSQGVASCGALGPGVHTDNKHAGCTGQSRHGPTWPSPLRACAYHGIAGEFVRLMEPHSEADPVAVHVQLLAAFGNVVGRGPHYMAEADRHGTNINAILVGKTSKARKGSSAGRVRSVLVLVDAVWCERRVQSGLSSGEGLIFAVRDPIWKKQTNGDGEPKPELVDEGIDDKRLYVLEGEYASTLRVMQRDGNTLSPVLRNAWDGVTLQSLTKNTPLRATGAHISIVGHITAGEAQRYLDRTEAGNGYGNRFLWVCARRSKELPEGGNVPEGALERLAQAIKARVDFARSVGRMDFDSSARALWHQVYGSLSEGQPGLLGAMTARAEAQVVRLALIYALLDGSSQIRREHLLAALEVWRYCEDSATFVFGESLGNPMADQILRALRSIPEGLDRTQIRDMFSRNRSGQEVDRALDVLLQRGLASSELVHTGGRPKELWKAAERTTETTKRGSWRDVLSFPSFMSSGESSGTTAASTADDPVSRSNPASDSMPAKRHPLEAEMDCDAEDGSQPAESHADRSLVVEEERGELSDVATTEKYLEH